MATATKKGLKVLNLQIENFKKFDKLDVPINGNHVYLVGPNGSGKSTFIDAIYAALSGKDIPTKSIKQGEEHGKIVVEIGDGGENTYTVELSFTEAKQKGYLKLKMNNFTSSSPRRDLDELIGNIAFDPFEFIELGQTSEGRRKQAQIVRDFLGISFDDLEEARKAAYEKRTLINYDVKNHKETMDRTGISEAQMGKYKDKIDIAAVSKQISEAEQKNQKHQYVEDGIEEKKKKVSEITGEIEDIEQQIDGLMKKKDEKVKQQDQMQGEIEKGNKWLKDNEKVETTELEEQLEKAEEHNEKVEDVKRYTEALAEHRKASKTSEQLTEQITNLDKQKEERIKSANCPVEGLGFDDEGAVTIDGLPFDDNQIEKSRIIKIGVELLMAMNPNLKIIRIKDGSLLDPQRKKAIEELIQNNGYQAFIEFVSQDEKADDLEVTIVEDLTKKQTVTKVKK